LEAFGDASRWERGSHPIVAEKRAPADVERLSRIALAMAERAMVFAIALATSSKPLLRSVHERSRADQRDAENSDEPSCPQTAH
jgi:hypothetical protein